MTADRNLLFAVVALQSGLINQSQFVEAYAACTSGEKASLAQLLIDRGWINNTDRQNVDALLAQHVSAVEGSVEPELSALSNEIKRSLASLGNDQLSQTLTMLPIGECADLDSTVTHVPQLQERYELLRLHAEGGMGRVWIAEDAKLRRRVALKELRTGTVGDDQARIRFLNEAAVTGRLNHPGIVPVYDLSAWDEGGEPFYTMPFMEGRTLSEAAKSYHADRNATRDEFYSFLELVGAFVTVCDTIEYAHSRGVIHRDLKGSNIVLGSFGEAVILDWGLARVGGREVAFDESHPAVNVDAGLTIEGQAMGTPAYMAPE